MSLSEEQATRLSNLAECSYGSTNYDFTILLTEQRCPKCSTVNGHATACPWVFYKGVSNYILK